MIANLITYGKRIYKEWLKCRKEGYKTFLIYKDEDDFYEKIPEEVYSVFDSQGNFVGDLLDSDFYDFYAKGVIINIDEFAGQRVTEEYPLNIGSYFVRKDHQEAIPMIKRQRCIIVILDKS